VAILAAADAGPIAVLFAAMHPERVSALVLLNTSGRYMAADDYPDGVAPDDVDALVKLFVATWGTPELIRQTDPSMAADVEYVEATARMARAAATPRTAAAQYDYIFRSLDVRQALPLVQAPTLVLHVAASPFVPIEHGRLLAAQIDGAAFVELEGGDLFAVTPDNYVVVQEVAEFLTGERPAVEIERVLTTMLFTDIVGSTDRVASLGDHRWRAILDAHDRNVREQLRKHRGHEIETAGDSFFVSFDGPARAIRCAQEIVLATEKLGIELRVGLHTGEVEVRRDHLGGLAVHIAARVGALATAGEVLVSRTVKDLVVGSGIEFIDRGEHELKGVPGTWRLYAVQR
jgi:class 3 adenylate cyclase